MTDINKDFLDLTGLTFGIDKWLSHKVEGDYDANVKLAKFILWHMPAGALFASNDKEESKWHDLKMQLVTDMCDTLDVDIHDVIDDGGDTPVEDRYLTFTAMENGSSVSMIHSGNLNFNINLQYSLDSGNTWEDYTIGNIINLDNGDNVKFKGINTTFYIIRNKTNGLYKFNMRGIISASGDITSILNERGGNCELNEWCFNKMFQGCISLTTAPNLPSTDLANYCYNEMFRGCTSLIQAPELPATTLANNCYKFMFGDCTSLIQAPELPATTLAESCCVSMFNGCTALIQAPEILPATTLTNSCYYGMFVHCRSLKRAPELPATILANKCYQSMFEDCIELIIAPSLPSTTLAESCYQNMFQYCVNLTQVPEILPATILAINCYQDMFTGCTSLTQAPELPATQLANNCYNSMFSGCTSLNTVMCLATSGINENYSTLNWLSNVSGSGTFTRAAGTIWPSGANGIPTGWTVLNENGTDINNDEDEPGKNEENKKE